MKIINNFYPVPNDERHGDLFFASKAYISRFFIISELATVKTAIYITHMITKAAYPLSISSCGALEFMP